VLGEDEPAYATLRPALTNPVCLARDVVDWLRLRRTALNPELEHVIHGIFEYALHAREVSETCRRIGEPESSARARFRKKGLPPPSAWHQAARSLYAALRIQASSTCSLTTIAHEQGYGNHASLSRQLLRVFGLRPSALRGTLGWEWLLMRWQARQVRAPCP
jgi:AraC-like DNA-binding protein